MQTVEGEVTIDATPDVASTRHTRPFHVSGGVLLVVGSALLTLMIRWPWGSGPGPLVIADVVGAVLLATAAVVAPAGGDPALGAAPLWVLTAAWAVAGPGFGAEAPGDGSIRVWPGVASALVWTATAWACLQHPRTPGPRMPAAAGLLVAAGVLVGAGWTVAGPSTPAAVAVGAAAVATAAVMLVWRRQQLDVGQARLLAPVATAGLLAAVAFVGCSLVAVIRGDPSSVRSSTLLVMVVPLTVLLVRATDWVVTARAVSLLSASTGVWSVEAIEGDLQRALRDPRLRLELLDSWDGDGGPRGGHDEARAGIVLASSTGDPLARVHLDPRVAVRGRRVRSVLVAARPALEHARLLHDSEVQLARLRESRRSIATSALAERARLERNLHDGAQHALLATSMRVETIRMQIHDPDVMASLALVREELRAAHRDLREVASSVFPAVLDSAGLAAALEVLAETLPFVLDVVVDIEGVDHDVQVIGYFAVHDVLAAFVRDGDAADGVIAVDGRRGGDTFGLRIDGPGSGPLRGPAMDLIRDRLHALGGLVGGEATDQGWSVEMSIPCE
jgi:signal transduction histidine kinase